MMITDLGRRSFEFPPPMTRVSECRSTRSYRRVISLASGGGGGGGDSATRRRYEWTVSHYILRVVARSTETSPGPMP